MKRVAELAAYRRFVLHPNLDALAGLFRAFAFGTACCMGRFLLSPGAGKTARVGGMCAQGHVGEHVRRGGVEDGSELRNLRPNLVGDGSPMGAVEASGVYCANAVAMKAETTRLLLLPAWATFIGAWRRRALPPRRPSEP